MNVSIFPKRDRYFSEGIAALFPVKVTDKEIKVLNLSKWSLKEIIISNWVDRNSLIPMVIITEPSLMPLAEYFQLKNRFCIIINTKNLVIPSICSHTLYEDIFKAKKTSNKCRLTLIEYRTLKCFLNSISVYEEAYAYETPNKTVYSVRSRVATKLGVRKLTEILLW